jgi:hypothetical protein
MEYETMKCETQDYSQKLTHFTNIHKYLRTLLTGMGSSKTILLHPGIFSGYLVISLGVCLSTVLLRVYH